MEMFKKLISLALKHRRHSGRESTVDNISMSISETHLEQINA
uniref:Uncharacterized protein n=1 Tax=Manihot esculenta TaxID=3983 RepID=A0A2C9VAB2_MANES